jgi:2-dehydropantoate 2-reductase
MGAGAIGCYVGGRLAAASVDVVFVGRARTQAELDASGLELRDLDGGSVRIPSGKIAFATEPRALADRDVVLCCVKSGQTAGVAQQLAAVLPQGAIVASLQNGLRNAEMLRAGMPEQTVLAGIVGFNVVARGNGIFHCATSGPLVFESIADARLERLAAALSGCGFELELARDIRPLQWTKLLMNLNNAISALSDRPTQELIFATGYRRILAAIIGEALGVLRRASIRPARLGAPLPVSMFPLVLRLPTPLLRLVARAQIKIDPEARSSMWDDLAKGRLTEVDQLNGEIVRLAASCGGDAPLNRRVVDLVHEVERNGRGSPKLTADALWLALTKRPGENAASPSGLRH